MAMITLTKAGRLQDSVRRVLGTLTFRGETTVSIFVADPRAEIARRAAALAADIERADRLLSILAEIRALVGTANAESGIAALLAERAGLEERIRLFSALLPKSREGSLFGPPPVPRDAETVTEQMRAMRARFEAAEGGDDALETSLLDDAALATLRERIAAARRRLEEVGDRLRELNGSARIAVADDILDWLRGETVI